MKTITEITSQQKNKKRCNIFLDGEFFCGMQLITVMQHRLKVGTKIAEQELNRIVVESETETAKQAAFSYVSKSMHTESQVKKYLTGKGFLPEVVDSVILKLKEYGYVNDATYTKSYFEQRKNCKGKRLIAYELKTKGVDEKTIDEATENAQSEEDGAYYTAVKFMKNKEMCFENITKCYRRLMSKGFDFDVAKSTIDRLKRENEFSED